MAKFRLDKSWHKHNDGSWSSTKIDSRGIRYWKHSTMSNLRFIKKKKKYVKPSVSIQKYDVVEPEIVPFISKYNKRLAKQRALFGFTENDIALKGINFVANGIFKWFIVIVALFVITSAFLHLQNVSPVDSALSLAKLIANSGEFWKTSFISMITDLKDKVQPFLAVNVNQPLLQLPANLLIGAWDFFWSIIYIGIFLVKCIINLLLFFVGVIFLIFGVA